MSKAMHVFAIYDIQTEVWSLPMTAHSTADFTRNLAAQLERADVNVNMMARHPEDFELWSIGVYHDGVITPADRTMISRLSAFHAPLPSNRQPG